MKAQLLKPLNAFILACLLVFGALHYYSGKQEERYRDSSRGYLREAMQDISHWRSEDLRRHLAPQARDVVSSEQLESVIAQYRSLGNLLSMDEPVLSKLSAALSAFTSQRRLSYSFNARFDNGSALVTATLLVSDQGMSLYNFNITRDAR